jgi:hypothetical protein
MSRFVLLLSLLLAVYAMLVGTSIVSSVGAYPGGPDPAVTGGFGEPTCNQSGCHNSFELNAGRAPGLGDLVVSGLPTQYELKARIPMPNQGDSHGGSFVSYTQGPGGVVGETVSDQNGLHGSARNAALKGTPWVLAGAR